MNKDMIYFGIDISKDVFDVMDSNGTYFNLQTISKGLKSL